MRLIERGAKVLSERREIADGEDVAYTRPGAFTARVITAVCGFPKHTVDASLNAPARIESRRADFFVTAEAFAEVFPEEDYIDIKPERGDWIDRTIRGKVVRYLVISDKGQPAFEYADSEQKAYRIHTRIMAGVTTGGP